MLVIVYGVSSYHRWLAIVVTLALSHWGSLWNIHINEELALFDNYLLWNCNSFQIPFQILDALKLGRFQNAYVMQSFKLVRQFWHFLKVLLWRFFWREIHQMSWNRWTLIMETSAPGWMSKRHSNHNFINVFLQNKIHTCIKNTFKWVVCTWQQIVTETGFLATNSFHFIWHLSELPDEVNLQ